MVYGSWSCSRGWFPQERELVNNQAAMHQGCRQHAIFCNHQRFSTVCFKGETSRASQALTQYKCPYTFNLECEGNIIPGVQIADLCTYSFSLSITNISKLASIQLACFSLSNFLFFSILQNLMF